jgi:hypothetical protein
MHLDGLVVSQMQRPHSMHPLHYCNNFVRVHGSERFAFACLTDRSEFLEVPKRLDDVELACSSRMPLPPTLVHSLRSVEGSLIFSVSPAEARLSCPSNASFTFRGRGR